MTCRGRSLIMGGYLKTFAFLWAFFWANMCGTMACNPQPISVKPPTDDELEVTDKITFTVARREDGNPVGSFDIGIFGGIFPVTAKNFIALAQGKYGNQTLPYKYVESTFPDDGSDDYFMRG